MTPVSVEVEVFGEPVLRRRLLSMGDRMTDATEGFRAVRDVLENAARRQFGSAGRYGGVPWQRLADSTIARKGHARILRATDRLMNSLLQRAHPDHVEKIGPDTLRWGSSVEYGKFHQSRRARTRLPWRPVVRLPERDRRSAVRALQRSVLEGRR